MLGSHSVLNHLSLHLLSKSVNIEIYKTIISSVVLYVCETLSLTLREEYRLRLFESRVLRISRLKKDKVPEEWRKLYNEKFHILYSSPGIITYSVVLSP
jgi:hypothetical protein